MKAVIQRVTQASVRVTDKDIGKIKQGILVFLGINRGDNEEDAEILADKIINLRVFGDKQGKMNLSLLDKKGELLIISQFTLCADTDKGRRPGFSQAASPQRAKELYNFFITTMRKKGIKVKTGSFGEYMQVSLENDGPATFILDA